jgi:ubiquitin carboxyl-terminal hydrolase 10
MANNGGGGGWLEVGKKQKTHVVRSTVSNDTAISRIFGGTLRSVLHAPGPGSKDSVTIEPYQPLQLDIQSDSVHSIADALRHVSVPETVQTWSAAKKANVDATKTVYLEATPPVLILHLKRFVYDPQRGEVGKKDKAVAYPEGLVIPPGTYIISTLYKQVARRGVAGGRVAAWQRGSVVRIKVHADL